MFLFTSMVLTPQHHANMTSVLCATLSVSPSSGIGTYLYKNIFIFLHLLLTLTLYPYKLIVTVKL